MKHLHKFESFISPGLSLDQSEDIKDICLELSDIGYSIDIYSKHIIYIRKKLEGDLDDLFVEFPYSDVSDAIERLKDYFKQDGIHIHSISVETERLGFAYPTYHWLDHYTYSIFKKEDHPNIRGAKIIVK